MRFPLLVSLASLFAFVLVQVSFADDGESLLPATSPCVSDCANKAAIAIKCKDFSDVGCYCSNQEFMVQSAKCQLRECPSEALNATKVNTSFAQLELLCRLANGHFGLHLPTLAELGLGGNSTTTLTSSQQADSSSRLVLPFFPLFVSTTFIAALILGFATLLA